MNELTKLTETLARVYEVKPAEMRRRLMAAANRKHLRPLIAARQMVAALKANPPRLAANRAFAKGTMPAGVSHEVAIKHAKAIRRVVTRGETLAQAYDHILADEADHDRRDLARKLGLPIPEAAP